MNRRGFTLIELMVVLGILGILAGLAVPRYQRYRQNAVAAQAVAEFKVIQNAAYNYNGETDSWPGTSGIGVVPADMVDYLPGSFTFDRDEYDMRWIAFGNSMTPFEIAVLVYYPTDPALGRRIANQLGQGYQTFPIANGAVVFVLMIYQIY